MGANFPPTLRNYDVRLVVSALQKTIRRSDVDGALYWAYELDKSGFGNWAWKRLRVICSEDIGPEVPGLASDVRALYENWRQADKKDGSKVLYLTHAVIALANAPKSRVVDWAVWYHNSDNVERREIPDVAVDKHTMQGRRMGRGNQHFLDEGTILIDPKEAVFDGDASERLAHLEAEYRALAAAGMQSDNTLPDNPWLGQVEFDPDTGEVFDQPPTVHRLPGMD